MKRKFILCLILCIGMLPLGCFSDTKDPGSSEIQFIEPDTEHVLVQSTDSAGEPIKQPEATAPEVKIAPEADATPYVPREPIAGDICTDRFPNYDTGEDADYSYQSDELRVAIKKVVKADEGQTYYVADIWVRNISSFRMGFAKGKFNTGHENPESFANRDNVIFGVSGSFNKGLVIHNGEKTKDVESKLIDFTSGIIVIYNDGTVKAINRNNNESFRYNKEQNEHGGIRHALQFGPILVQDGKAVQGLKKNGRHPRIMFGYYEPGHYVAVAVDGRKKKKAIGMTEIEMAQLMESLGCECAMNLDGGTSAVMLFMGRTINTPSGVDKDGDGIAGRNIVDMLEFAEYDENGVAPALSTVYANKFLGD